MKTTTLELIRSVLKADETVTRDERGRIIRMMSAPGEVAKAERVRVVPFTEAADRLGVKRGTIYLYCHSGILRRAVLTGKRRASGVTEESLEGAIRGSAGRDGPCFVPRLRDYAGREERDGMTEVGRKNGSRTEEREERKAI